VRPNLLGRSTKIDMMVSDHIDAQEILPADLELVLGQGSFIDLVRRDYLKRRHSKKEGIFRCGIGVRQEEQGASDAVGLSPITWTGVSQRR